ncbi:MAG: hypothetical protein PHC75_08115 [Burkholderiales bacterium]|nr:hypothetical protein [Burkholderiales bacterium]
MQIFLEILGGFIFFSFISLLSLIIIPSIFGCAGFILFWIILISLVVAFSISFKWIGVAAIIIYGVLLFRRYLRYSNLPTYDDYLTDNPNIYQDGVTCKHCGSHTIANRGLFGNSGKARFCVCLSCRKWLYRFKVL